MHDWVALKEEIRDWGRALGFTAVGFAGSALEAAAARHLQDWLAAGYHGTMDYMARHGLARARPATLLASVQSIIVCRMDYLTAPCRPASADFAEIARYARGRDYHKTLRARLRQLAARITARVGSFAHRICVDSAPLMEVELAQRAGLGWRGKHTLMLSRSGSWCFLGELLTDLPLPPDAPADAHCGRCRACLDICPTQAIVAPYRLDARRCIAYLTIEHAGSIPEEFRPALGNRIYGCDDCQQVCPWNRFAPLTREVDFLARPELDQATLVELFAWSETEFNDRLAGSPIRRIGHERWLRNIAVALGNAPTNPTVKSALVRRADHPSALVREHVAWALQRHQPGASPVT